MIGRDRMSTDRDPDIRSHKAPQAQLSDSLLLHRCFRQTERQEESDFSDFASLRAQFASLDLFAFETQAAKSAQFSGSVGIASHGARGM